MTDDAGITQLLDRWSEGDEEALEKLAPLVYQRLHELAESAFRNERGAHTLQPTAIVNEAYLKLADASVDWHGSSHFFALAARMMRRILVNHAQARRAGKRGGGQVFVTYDEAALAADAPGDDVLELDEALDALAELDPRKVEILELHYFGGMSYEQAGTALGVSPATVKRDLRFGRAWIRRYLDDAAKA